MINFGSPLKSILKSVAVIPRLTSGLLFVSSQIPFGYPTTNISSIVLIFLVSSSVGINLSSILTTWGIVCISVTT